MTNVLVFRTNLNTPERLYRAACRLCILMRGDFRWSVDAEDCDCVLRIETDSLTEGDIVHLLTQAGLECIPLV